MELHISRPLAFFDLETTGLLVATARIIEISIYKVTQDGNHKTYTKRINPGIPIPPESTAIHGISDEDVKDMPTFKELANELNQFLFNCDLAGYNSNKYDIPLLVEEFLRADIDFELKGRRFVDVQNIFHKMEPRTLSAAYKFYCGKKLENAHSAEADTMATYEILKAQLAMYENTEYEDKNGEVSIPIKNNVQALHEFSFKGNNVDLVGHIVFNEKGEEVLNFGKHKGRPVAQIFQNEPSYYDWMMKSDFPLSTKKVITQIKLRYFNKGANKTLF